MADDEFPHKFPTLLHPTHANTMVRMVRQVAILRLAKVSPRQQKISLLNWFQLRSSSATWAKSKGFFSLKQFKNPKDSALHIFRKEMPSLKMAFLNSSCLIFCSKDTWPWRRVVTHWQPNVVGPFLGWFPWCFTGCHCLSSFPTLGCPGPNPVPLRLTLGWSQPAWAKWWKRKAKARPSVSHWVIFVVLVTCTVPVKETNSWLAFLDSLGCGNSNGHFEAAF